MRGDKQRRRIRDAEISRGLMGDLSYKDQIIVVKRIVVYPGWIPADLRALVVPLVANALE